MDMYKRLKFIDKFTITNNEIIKCPNKILPSHSEKTNNILVALFSTSICDKCRFRKNCIFEKYDDENNKVEIDINKGINVTSLKQENSEVRIKMLYQKASALMKQNQSDMALIIFEELYNEVANEYSGGICVGIAEIKLGAKIKETLIDKNKGIKIDECKEIEMLYLEALQIKEENQIALAGIAIYYFYSGEFTKSIKYLKKIKNENSLWRYLKIISDIDINYRSIKYINKIESIDFEKTSIFYENVLKYLKKRKKSDVIIKGIIDVQILVAYYYLENDMFVEAYSAIKEIEKMDLNSNYKLRNDIYEILGLICLPMYLNRPREALKYYNSIVGISNNISINSNKSMCYIDINEIDEAILILENQLRSFPNNTDYYNLAKAYYKEGNYEKARLNIEAALTLFEDETSYLLASCISKELGDVEDAIYLGKKALYFFEHCELDFFPENDDTTIISTMARHLKNETYINILENLTYSYIEGDKFKEAFAINQSALIKYPFENKFKNNFSVLKKLMDVSMEANEIKETLDKIKREKEELKIESLKSREWMKELIILKNKYEKINDLHNKSWGQFELNVEKILNKMKKETADKTVDFKEIYEFNKKKFNGISEKALTCLTTGEYLYQCNKGNYIDFSPVIVELSKVFEIELNIVLRNNKHKTLGQILSNQSIGYNNICTDILDNVEKIRKIRNDSAHVGVLKQVEVENIRNMIYEKDTLLKLLVLKCK